MCGNVWEWVADRKRDYTTDVVENPQGPSSGSNCIYRGGSWFNDPWSLRLANRNRGEQSYRDHRVGFRLALP